MEDRRLIEEHFPLKQASLDSVHEKNVRHGHISTLHIWPARRPLAASRAALISTLLRDPGTEAGRKALADRMGGTVRKETKKKKLPDGSEELQEKEETRGGILHWGRENDDLDYFRQAILEAYEGRAPRVLDPFSGGGAIPLEAMRLGCEVTAVDINPVAWFLLKCTLEYPQRLAGKNLPLPDFALQDRKFMRDFLLAQGLKPVDLTNALHVLGLAESGAAQPGQMAFSEMPVPSFSTQGDLAWQVRSWGSWVLRQARADLASFYPVVDQKPTVAYLWARTVACKNCRATLPLLKTRWLCKKDRKRVALGMQLDPARTGVIFSILLDVPPPTGSAAQKREAERAIGGGTMSSSGAKCPCCGTLMKMDEIRREGLAGRLGMIMTAVVVDGEKGKEYRLPTEEEVCLAREAEQGIERVFAELPFGVPKEPLPGKEALGFRVPLYGFDQWYKLFTPRQLLAIGIFVKYTRAVCDVMRQVGYGEEWVEAVSGYLALSLDRMLDRLSTGATWDNTRDGMSHVFHRFALPIVWDFGEANPFSDAGGGYIQQIDWTTRYAEHALKALLGSPNPHVLRQSATLEHGTGYDAIVTDPPYSDLMDFFYVWLRRTLHGLTPEIDGVFAQPLTPKWDHEANDGELIDDASRFGGNKAKSKANYENGMARVFQGCCQALVPNGRLVIVFAHKHPDAWETLVSAIIRAGFVVDGSWPIQTEMGNRTRALASAALSSSVWLVCKKRPATARPGWDTGVLAEMRANISVQLDRFWDAGIRGPDFVWAATGPALEAYSKYPVVRKTQKAQDAHPGDELLKVGEFLQAVRRMVADYMVGRVFSRSGGDVSGLDDVTTYYLLHRFDFKLASVPSGPCILYATSCGLSDSALTGTYDLLERSGGRAVDEDEDDEGGEGDDETGSGSSLRLKVWNQRKRPNLGLSTAAVPIPPLIDQVHRLMRLWEAGELGQINAYLDERGIHGNPLFTQLLQALAEMAPLHSVERSRLDNISKHIKYRNASPAERLF